MLRPVCAALWVLSLVTTSAAVDLSDFRYVSPLPDARFVATGSTLILRPQRELPADWTSRVTVAGDRSGAIRGTWIVADDGATRIFRPATPFAAGETVTVSLSGRPEAGGSYSFRVVARTASHGLDPLQTMFPDGVPDRAGSGATAPRTTRGPFPLPAGFPEATVTRSDDPTQSSIFLSNLVLPGQSGTPYLMILDNTGFPVFFREMPGNCLDFKMQPTGVLTYHLDDVYRFYVMDATYAVVDSVSAGDGGPVDGHELRLLPNGHALVMIYEARMMDMSAVVPGGDPDATVVGTTIEELDSSRNVVFRWSTFDWMDVTDAADDIDLTASTIDWTHANAIDVEDNGDLLLSFRHLDEITKVSRSTGEIIWRLGGKRNRFTFVGMTRPFSHQHGVRRLPGGDVILFDNANAGGDSRALELHLDEENLVATRVWDQHRSPPAHSWAMGFAHRLRNGNTFVSWGSESPACTEYRPDGTVAFELELPPGVWSYRTRRYHWKGAEPAPTVWTVDQGGPVPTLVFTRFGERTVNRFNVYGGTSPEPTTIVGSTEGNTFVPPLLAGTAYFRVTEVERNGAQGPYSNEVTVVSTLHRDEAEAPDDPVPAGATPLRNAPNPFRANTEIAAALPPGEAATVRIFNVLGQEIRTLRLPAAGTTGRVEWDGFDARGRSVPAGVYLIRLEAPGVTQTRRIVRVR